jgi:GH24 family phage-related lysozyme (muramidase)
MIMKLSALGAADIRLHEGFVDHWYKDAVGVGTIGIGFTAASSAFQKWWQTHKPTMLMGPGATMTRAEADDALIYLSDAEYGAAVARFLGHDVPQNVFDAMDSVVYNCGGQALGWQWAAAAKAGNYAGAGDLLKNTAITAQGKRLAGLVSRRADEARLLSTGVYATSGAAMLPHDDAMSDGVLVRGERGEAVANLQRRLTALGFQPGKADGVFGYGTESAVLTFQRDRKLPADGKAGPQTLAALAAG